MRIFVARKIPGSEVEKLKLPGSEVEKLKPIGEVIISEKDEVLAPGELIEKAKGVDGLLCLLTDKIDGDVMDAIGPQLKIISNYAVGFDNININDATDRGIVVTNTPCDEVNEAVAENTWALVLALARRVVESDEFVRQEGYFAGKGGYKGWEPDLFLGTNLIGKTLGIVGLGRIGTMVARRAQGYSMNIVYNKHSRDIECEEKMGIKYCTLDELLSQSDFVSLHVPLNDETRGMMSKGSFAKMKKGAYLINTARGPVVDESDLVEALKEEKLLGAALDVFESEPQINPELISMPNVILTPHIASATHEAREKMGELAVSAIISVLSGKKPETIVDEKVWEKRRK